MPGVNLSRRAGCFPVKVHWLQPQAFSRGSLIFGRLHQLGMILFTTLSVEFEAPKVWPPPCNVHSFRRGAGISHYKSQLNCSWFFQVYKAVHLLNKKPEKQSILITKLFCDSNWKHINFCFGTVIMSGKYRRLFWVHISSFSLRGNSA